MPFAAIWTLVRAYAPALGLLLLAVVLVGYAYVRGSHSRDVEVAGLRAQIDERDRTIDRVRRERDSQVHALEGDFRVKVQAIDAARARDVALAGDRERAAIGRMRAAEARARERPLAPAASAPAPCREFAADPTLLPLVDRELLVRLGAAADRVVLERNACVAAYAVVRDRFEQLADEVKADLF